MSSRPLIGTSDDELTSCDEGLDSLSPLMSPPLSPSHTSHPYIEKETSATVRKVLKAVGLKPLTNKRSRTKDGAMEALDYNLFASAVNLASLRPLGEWDWRFRAGKRWVLVIVVGVLVALLATLIIFITKQLTSVKFIAVNWFISDETSDGSTRVWGGAGVYVGISCGFSLAAALLVTYIEPLATGSGIPELKAYMNGVNMPRLLRFKTLVAKTLSLPLAISSGLPFGFEGPMAHIGACVGAMVSQGKSSLFGFTLPVPSTTFRLDAQKREFCAVGAAAGVAAAFNAPAGAVVFIIEECGIRMWAKGLLWRAFMAAIIAAYVIDFLLSGIQDGTWGRLTARGMFSFGLSDESEVNQNSVWNLYEIPLFIVIGVLGGASGALFNVVNKQLMGLRAAFVGKSRVGRVMETLVCTVIASLLSFGLPLNLGRCLSNPTGGSIGNGGAWDASQFFCPPGQYNDLASLWFVPPEDSIRSLFHLKAGSLSIQSLLTFWGAYLSLMCLTGGTGVPSGHFIPSLLAGSALGRAVGEVGRALLPPGLPIASPGAYAAIGAASMLGGILRLSLSMAVILLEATGNAFFSLPLMVTLVAARFTGSLLSEGLYEVQLELKAWPVLEESLPKHLAYSLRACDVMTAPPLVIPEVERAGEVLRLLLACGHGGFPVVFAAAGASTSTTTSSGGSTYGEGGGAASTTTPRTGTLAGYIQRRHLAVLLAQRVFHAKPPNGGGGGGVGGRGGGKGKTALSSSSTSLSPSSPSSPPFLPLSPSSTLGKREDEEGGGAPAIALFQPPSSHGDGTLRLRVPTATESHVLLHELLLLESTEQQQHHHHHRKAPTHLAGGRGGATSLLGGAASSSINGAMGGGSRQDRDGDGEDEDEDEDEDNEDGGGGDSSSVSIGGALSPPASYRYPRLPQHPTPHVSIGLGRLFTSPSHSHAALGASSPSSTHSLSLSSLQYHQHQHHPQQQGEERALLRAELAARLYTTLQASRAEQAYANEPVLTAAAFARGYPRFPNPKAITLTEAEAGQWVDLRPYMDATPVTVHLHAPLERAYKLFTQMGLRHLLCVDDGHNIVGIITRKELTKTRLEALAAPFGTFN